MVNLLPLELQNVYNTDLESFVTQLQNLLPLKISSKVNSWHMADSVLAWWSRFRYIQKVHTAYGLEEEGVIIV